uniref:ERAP1-like C-terminal domain-containing protein n=1 Tax=Graphocephala atropunctata TaxID=36148 RepID=A0A1B6KBI8_9HEMI
MFTFLQNLVRSFLSSIYHKFGDLNMVPKGMEETQLKALITKWACKYEVGDCAQNANQMFKAWMSNNTYIPKDLREVVYCEGIRQGKMTVWNYVWNQYLASNVASEKKTFLQALACTTRATRMIRFMESTLNSTLIRKQDAVTVFSHVAQNSILGYRYCVTFLTNEIQRLHNHFAPETEVLGQYIIILARQSVFAYQVQDLKNILRDNKELFEKSQFGVSQGMEAAESNVQWMKLFYSNISDALTV